MKEKPDMKETVVFSDIELITSLGKWLLSSTSWRTRMSSGTNGEDAAARTDWLLEHITVQDMLDAGAMLRQALEAQPEDVARILEETAFVSGAYPLLHSGWGRGGLILTDYQMILDDCQRDAEWQRRAEQHRRIHRASRDQRRKQLRISSRVGAGQCKRLTRARI